MPEPCQSCGACCDGGAAVFRNEPHFDRLFPIWADRIAPNCFGIPAETNLDGDRTRCVALAGRIGYRVFCRIYSIRPDVCRSFDVGCPECNEARVEYGLEPV